MNHKIFNKVIIIGLGLMGGSLAKACKKYNISDKILAFDSNDKNVFSALKNGVIHDSFSFEDNLSKNDLIIISTPLSSYGDIQNKILSTKAIVTDIGSLKRDNIINFFSKEVFFFPSHPICGSEKSGFDNSREDLFFCKKVFITKKNDSEYYQKIIEFWNRIGSKPEELDPELHDKAFALVSHLPQLISFLSRIEDSYSKYFRLEKSQHKIWKDIFILNSDNLINYINEYKSNLELVINVVEGGNLEKIYNISEKAKNISKIKKINIVDNLSLQMIDKILFKIFLVTSFVLIKDIKRYFYYKGGGYEDFVSILDHNFLIKKHFNRSSAYVIKKLHDVNNLITYDKLPSL